MRRALTGLAFAAILALLLIQLIPYGRDHNNPPVRAEPQWDSPTTRELAVRACYDCHSNEVNWPWYSNIAPVSWLVQRDVDKGRDELNFSEWDREGEGEDAAETVRKRRMPPPYYLPLHPEARLSATERTQLTQGLATTMGTQGEGGEDEEEEEDDD